MKKILLVVLLAVISVSFVRFLIISRPKKAPREHEQIKPAAVQLKKKAGVQRTAVKAKIAFVIDDFGYNTKNIDAFFDLGIPVTLSILPNLAYSERVALEARERNHEVIVHLPLEPHESTKPLEKHTIFCDMEEGAVELELERALKSIRVAVGISNHMGSKATENERLMTIIFNKLKEHNLFFMDNLVTSASVCGEVAEKTGIRLARRSVFLDNSSDSEYIKGQIRELQRQALATGWAVGVGHDREGTVLAIKDMIPELEKSGIGFAYLSEFAQQ